ncbi:iduronate 2-sulfatase [Catalinimonas alkaloidigena]|uniref:sulfatase n=1 Tax=Catalinimonas alkaloidigena TaxID=1075417 RepID=UPI0024068FA8|nr:sulfatase [Catalinimonas alkaloidigena]MDF9798594.1 iduronate 2-sulfatase [Catalinimonas alkaloidigena]
MHTTYYTSGCRSARFLKPGKSFSYLFYVITISLALLHTSTALFAQSETSTENRSNVLFIAIDDLNDWLGVMQGHPDTKTPHMDKLAERGVLFQNAHCQAPLCGPSRASIMTGLRPSTTGIYGMVDDEQIKVDNEVTSDIILLPEYFKQQGYHTMGIGKLFHQHAPDSLFDESGGRYKGFGPLPEERFVWDGFGGENYGRTSTDWGAFPVADSLMPDQQSAEWAIERLEKEYEQPFFLAVGFLRPHVPLYVPQPWFEMHPAEGLTMPPYKADDLEDVPPVAHKINDLPMMPSTEWAIESGSWGDIIQAYLACVSFVDDQVGKLVNALEESPHAENTIIVLWSDHGYRMGEKGTFAKHALWEEATQVPLIFAGKDIPEGKIVSEPVELLSLYPTLLELSGLPAYHRNEGRSLVPLIRGEATADEWHAITTFGMNNHAVRTKDYRYIQYEDGGEEFYDHNVDPQEWNNMADHPMYQKAKADVKKHLPQMNVPWTRHSSYTFQPYFVEQKARSDEAQNK